MKIAIKDIKLSPYQVRDLESDPDLAALAESIKEHGQLQPIKVRVRPEIMARCQRVERGADACGLHRIEVERDWGSRGSESMDPELCDSCAAALYADQEGDVEEPYWECVFGHRRLRAMERAGFEQVEALLADLTDGQAALQNLVENIQRLDLSIPEKGQCALQILAALEQEAAGRSVSLADVANMLGVQRDAVIRWCRVAKKLSPHAQELAVQRKLNDHALTGLVRYSHAEQDRIANILAEARDDPAISFGYGTIQRFFKLMHDKPSLAPAEALQTVLSIQPETPVTDVLEQAARVNRVDGIIDPIDGSLSERLEERRQEAIAAGAPPEITYEDLIKGPQAVVNDVIYRDAKADAERTRPPKGPMTVSDYTFRLQNSVDGLRRFMVAGRQIEIWEVEAWPIVRGFFTDLASEINEFIREADDERRHSS